MATMMTLDAAGLDESAGVVRSAWSRLVVGEGH
jgi:hypothetical protein